MFMMMFRYGGGGWPFWEVALMWAGMLAFLGVLIWVGYALTISAIRKPGRGRRGQDTRQVLDGRLARGEIDSAQYQRLRDLLA
jgi:uncharacterized membrane protein